MTQADKLAELLYLIGEEALAAYCTYEHKTMRRGLDNICAMVRYKADVVPVCDRVRNKA